MTPLEYLRWMAYSLVAAAVCLFPFGVAVALFHRCVEVPGCKADCAARDAVYLSYVSRRSGAICTCVDAYGRPDSFRANYGFVPDHSLVGGLLDAVARVGTMLVLAVAWYGFLFFVFRSFTRSQRQPGGHTKRR